MREYQSQHSSSSRRRRGTLVATLAVVVLGTAGFAAAGGVELLKGWFITVEVDGQVIEVDDADVVIETEGDTATLTLDLGELGVDVEEGATATVTLVGSGLETGGEPNDPGRVHVSTVIAGSGSEAPEEQD